MSIRETKRKIVQTFVRGSNTKPKLSLTQMKKREVRIVWNLENEC